MELGARSENTEKPGDLDNEDYSAAHECPQENRVMREQVPPNFPGQFSIS
jgi:hypothetical protein